MSAYESKQALQSLMNRRKSTLVVGTGQSHNTAVDVERFLVENRNNSAHVPEMTLQPESNVEP